MNYHMSRLKPFGVLIEPKYENTHINEIDITSLRELFFKEQLILIRGFTTFTDSENFSQYCEKWGEISIWPFGKVLELIRHEKPRDHIFDNSYVPLHWDGMYRSQVPEYQIFHCVKAPLSEQGGRTTFTSTPLVLKNAEPEMRSLWSKVRGSYHRKMEFYHSKITSPIVTKHPFRDFPVIRYNEPHSSDRGVLINIPDLEFSGVEKEELDDFHHTLREALYHHQNLYAHEWQDGDVVIADNLSLLHGREGFDSLAPRHLQRVQVLSDPPYENSNLEVIQ